MPHDAYRLTAQHQLIINQVRHGTFRVADRRKRVDRMVAQFDRLAVLQRYINL